ncbi:hypothetical protein GCM10007907_05370 [Chitinimonas prasina]|uniref:DUF6916 domain-containing protein n=1 Tax=Chitinimonas prasina TaxID=1434937 RepID=A0ABQ5Y9X5_9NEIS|nr:hypothetical protein [Chitinimonas prasina]GLR11747.1 hypothetical protein GCM10007907_05370 [Chitinimonas prasina]
MLDTLRYTDIAHTVNQSWSLQDSEGATLALQLISAIEKPAWHAPALSPRVPFLLSFLGPLTPVIPQGLYILSHPAIGRLEGVLVTPQHATGSRQDGHCYQVNFN